MRIYKLVSKKKAALVWLITGLVLCTLLAFPTQCRNGAANGLFLCIQVLIPSLLPFMILSSFMVNSGILCRMPKLTGFISNKVFGLPKSAFGVILLSLIGGYPVGATGIKSLYKEGYITEKQAERMAMFCVSAGPGFLVTYIGAAMTRQVRAGYIMLVSQIISGIILGFISKITIKDTDKKLDTPKKAVTLNIRSALVTSVNEGIISALKMSTLVILFGSVAEIFLYFTTNTPQLSPMVALLEITNGIKVTADRYSFELISFLCGFGGLCVHFQVFQQLEGISVSKGLFYIFRILQGFLCSILTKILLYFFPVTQEVLSTVSNAKPAFQTGIIGCVFLFITCAGFMISVKSMNLSSKSNKP